MELILIALLFIILPAYILYLNGEAKRIFSYMESNHKALWIKLGSPKRIPGIVANTKEPAFTFLFEGGYREIEDSKLAAMCSNIDKLSRYFAVALGMLFIGFIVYGASSI